MQRETATIRTHAILTEFPIGRLELSRAFTIFGTDSENDKPCTIVLIDAAV